MTRRGGEGRMTPRRLTPAARVVFLDAIRNGQTVRAAAGRARLTRESIYHEMRINPTFVLQVQVARDESEARLIDSVTKSAHTGETVTTPGGQVTVRPGDWRAAAWLLEHHPDTRERYAAINKAQIGGDPDNPTAVPVEVVGASEGGTMERLARVVTVLQRAGVMPLPDPANPVIDVIDVTPEEKNGH